MTIIVKKFLESRMARRAESIEQMTDDRGQMTDDREHGAKGLRRKAAKSTVDMLHKIETIEKEVMGLKLTVLKKLTPSGKNVVSLKGILKGVEITVQDINTAKKSLYSKVGLGYL